jgi:hypothetical protein
VIVRRPLGRYTGAALAAGYFVAANYFQFTNRFADTWLNPLQSYLLGAALLVWMLLYRSVHARIGVPVLNAVSFDRPGRRPAIPAVSVWRRRFRSRSL